MLGLAFAESGGSISCSDAIFRYFILGDGIVQGRLLSAVSMRGRGECLKHPPQCGRASPDSSLHHHTPYLRYFDWEAHLELHPPNSFEGMEIHVDQ
jgi:hypothetical protein